MQASVPKKIIWLASYPKSGNTWFRLFLTALLGDDRLNINETKTDGIFSSREIFENATDIDSYELTDEEVKELMPQVFNHVATEVEKERLFIKVHDAYTLNSVKQPIIPYEATICALYFIRNPLDLVASLANHNDSSLDDAIKLMNNPIGALSKIKNHANTNKQFKQLLLSWTGHVESWTGKLPFPVMVIRYEDMLNDTLNVFTNAVKFMGIEIAREKIENALNETKFDKLQQQEKIAGFAETISKNKLFFRKGTAGNWIEELNINQVNLIINKHQITMEKYSYNSNLKKKHVKIKKVKYLQ